MFIETYVIRRLTFVKLLSLTYYSAGHTTNYNWSWPAGPFTSPRIIYNAACVRGHFSVHLSVRYTRDDLCENGCL